MNLNKMQRRLRAARMNSDRSRRGGSSNPLGPLEVCQYCGEQTLFYVAFIVTPAKAVSRRAEQVNGPFHQDCAAKRLAERGNRHTLILALWVSRQFRQKSPGAGGIVYLPPHAFVEWIHLKGGEQRQATRAEVEQALNHCVPDDDSSEGRAAWASKLALVPLPPLPKP